MSDDENSPRNVVRLGTETLFAIGEELRRMYDADLRSIPPPSKRLERVMRWIERGEMEQGERPPECASPDPSEHPDTDE